MSTTFTPLVCVVDFHHARGPEIEHWIGTSSSSSDGDDDDANDPTAANDWHLIPYMALPDGAHQSEEEFSYFSLVSHQTSPGGGRGAGGGTAGGGEGGGGSKNDPTTGRQPTSVFGLSCVHQLDSSALRFRPADVTRSAVQKAVVAITDAPQGFSALRERLSAVTAAWFAQKDFRDIEILQRFQESLVKEGSRHEDERDLEFGLSLRELVHTFKWQTLVLLKSLLLQPKVQFALISLIPGLVRNLQDCADPAMDRQAELRRKPDSVRTSDRSSLLAFVGLPVNLFGKGSFFSPYTALQQLDIITDLNTKSYVVGSTNSLLLQQKERYCDILVNLDDDTITILSPALRAALALSVPDRRWIDFLTQAVNDTWDEHNPSRPNTHGYAGSEEFIRLQFEEYLIALLSATKYHQHLTHHHKPGDSRALSLPDIDGDPALDFALPFLTAWRATENYKLWDRTTDAQLFDLVEPRHPCAGGLTIEDVQRRLATQVAELHLDERLSQTREVVGRTWADGREQVASAFSRIWADFEVMREAQRLRAEEARVAAADAAAADAAAANDDGRSGGGGEKGRNSSVSGSAPAGTEGLTAGNRASAYFSSWGTWAAEKRKVGWGRAASATTSGEVQGKEAAGRKG